MCPDEHVAGMCLSHDNWHLGDVTKEEEDGYLKEEEKKCGPCQLPSDVYREELALGAEGPTHRLEWEMCQDCVRLDDKEGGFLFI